MLALGRRQGEKILIGKDIRICIISIDPKRKFVRIGIEADKDVRIFREELVPNLWKDLHDGESDKG